MVLFGPPGTGKTTLARLAAEHADAAFEELSAVNAGRAEVREVIERARQRRQTGRRTIFFLDEIHRFNKAQQDALLPAVEEGLVTLIGATTENPYFEVNNALLSRAQVYELRPLTAEQVEGLMRTALEAGECGDCAVADDVLPFLAARSGGDARTALNALELACSTAARTGKPVELRRRRGRDAAQGRPLRQGRRPALRLHLGLDQVHARVGPRRLALLPRRDARGRRGPALHRAPDGHPRLRGHRQRRPAGAAGRDGHGRGGRARRAAGGPRYALAQCAIYLSLAPKSNAAGARARRRAGPHPRPRRRSCRPRRCAAPPTRRRPSSAAGSATTTRTTTRARSTTRTTSRTGSRTCASTTRGTWSRRCASGSSRSAAPAGV